MEGYATRAVVDHSDLFRMLLGMREDVGQQEEILAHMIDLELSTNIHFYIVSNA